MRIIDINTAIGAPTKSKRFQDEAGLLQWMDEYRIDQAVTYHAEFCRSPWTGNSAMLSTSADSGGRIKACVGINPTLMEESLMGEGSLQDRLRVARPAAVRLFPENNDYLLDRFYARDLLTCLNELRMPVILDAQYDKLFFAELPNAAEAFPDIRFILLRQGLNHARYINPLLKHLRNVYFDMSIMLDVYQIEEIVKNYGSERLLFGSGLPFYEPSGALALLIYAVLSDADRSNIAHANFERLEAEIRYDV